LIISKKYLNHNKVFLLLNSEDKWLFNHIKNIIGLGAITDLNLSGHINKVIPVYVGSILSDYIVSYVYSCCVFLFNFISIRKLNYYSKRIYKVGVMIWNSALEPQGMSITNDGIDWVIGNDISKKDVLFYSHNTIGDKYIKKLNAQCYDYIDWSLSNIYRNTNYKELCKLLRSFIVTIFIYPFLIYRIPSSIVKKMPYIIYHYYRWSKFIQNYYFIISLSYNDYSLSSLIKNHIFLQNEIKPWSYVHSSININTYDKRYKLKNPFQAYINYDRRYYLIPEQVDYNLLSKIKSNETRVVGPLFRHYSVGTVLEDTAFNKYLYDKKVISIFSATYALKTKNSRKSHVEFITKIIDLIFMFEDVVFLFKGKNNDRNKYFSELTPNDSSIYKKMHELVDSNRLFLISNELSSGKLIRSSDLVISMPFTSPTIEGISSGVPSVYYDPCELFPYNTFNEITNLYFTSLEELYIFCNTN